jgi:hypothetical protein
LAPARDVEAVWLGVWQDVCGLAAHEVKDALNGVALNLEVIRSRSTRQDIRGDAFNTFAVAASDQLELVTLRIEALLYLTRAHRPSIGPVDVALTLRHLAALLVPAAKSDGKALTVEGAETSALTVAGATHTRAALAAGLLALIKEGGSGRCTLGRGGSIPGVPGSGAVVRFSHESAVAGLDPAVAQAIGSDDIRIQSMDRDLIIVFSGQA